MTFDPANIDAREDAQVRILLASGPVVVIILGGAHDLGNNLERLSRGAAEYLKVETKARKAIADSGK